MCFGADFEPPEAPEVPPPAPRPERTQDALGTKDSVRRRRRRAAFLGTEALRIPTNPSQGPVSL